MIFPKHHKIQQKPNGDLFLNFGEYGQKIEFDCFSADETRLLTVQEDKVVKVWDVDSNQVTAQVQPTSPLKVEKIKRQSREAFKFLSNRRR